MKEHKIIIYDRGSLTPDAIYGMTRLGYVMLEKLHPDQEIRIEPQMTLRDQFAMAALTGLLAARADLSAEAIVSYAYGYADSMLKKRDVDTAVPASAQSTQE